MKSPILGGFSRARSGDLASGEAYNLFLEIVESKDGKAPGALYNTAGLDLVGTLGYGPIRGVHKLGDTLYVVSGPQVWSVTANGTPTLCGNIGLRNTPVSMFDNGAQCMIVDGVGAWLVPGGIPLTGGAIEATGGLYAVNDTITLRPTTGGQSAYPILTVTTVSNTPATTVSLPNKGTSYGSAASAATTPIAGSPGAGAGLKVNIDATAFGPIAAINIAAGGAGYAVGNTGLIMTGSSDAAYLVTAVSGGAVTGIMLTSPGTAYATYGGATTTIGPGAPTNAGWGLTLNITAAGGPILSAVVANGGQGYAVGNIGFVSGGSGDATYQVTAIGTNGAVTGFTVTQGGALLTMPLSFKQQSTSGSGANFELYAPTFGAFVGLVPITVPFSGPIMGAISDGFGLLIFLGSQNIAMSDELDLSTWGALNYDVADQSPDKCISLVVIHDEAYVLKEKNTEVWVDGGLAGFAFQPMTGVHMEYGCVAAFSPVKIGEHLIWLSRNEQGQGLVVKASAYQVAPISTQAMVAEFDTYAQLGDAIGYARQQGGHTFYVLTFPEADQTWCYDMTASDLAGYPVWTRLASFSAGAWHRHWGNCFTPWGGYVTGQATSGGAGVLGDYRNGNLYAFNPNTLTDNGTQRRWLRRWRALAQGSIAAKRFSSLVVAMQTGAGVKAGSAPQLVLRWSDDGGATWSGERIVAAGALGATSQRIRFNRLGSTRRVGGSDRIFELSSSDPFMTALLDADVDAS
jgi:hypothetical protein